MHDSNAAGLLEELREEFRTSGEELQLVNEKLDRLEQQNVHAKTASDTHND